ncbi:hypothetical protein [Caproicibacter fermentans]|uniref:Uncharacterized protein n=1 Tax=Caproicibacter fermentans TaxID=2576756 RepID=A0A7G8TF18_9FIRM|nr:hypothetical protein [Caproicibacter fermentans]QNK42209.1 hypothetical protein HCR03_08365 [Caproicibacter fermentans]
MPRGVRKSIEDQISEIDLKIQELQEKKKQLLEEKEQEDIRQLLEAAKESGLTPADLVKKLTEKKESEE